MSKKMGNKKGFTIIEVVLVLAVAALIFLIVLLAVPALQRGRRDTARKSDVGRALSQLENYASNNNGDYPTFANFGTFQNAYLDTFKDPAKGSYNVISGVPAATGDLQYALGFKCLPNNTVTAAGGTRYVALVVRLENGGGTNYCSDNS